MRLVSWSSRRGRLCLEAHDRGDGERQENAFAAQADQYSVRKHRCIYVPTKTCWYWPKPKNIRIEMRCHICAKRRGRPHLSWIIVLTDAEGKVSYWTYGNPGKWVSQESKARLYAKRASANLARHALLRSHPDLKAEQLRVLDRSE